MAATQYNRWKLFNGYTGRVSPSNVVLTERNSGKIIRKTNHKKATYLLTWNPKYWDKSNIEEACVKTVSGEPFKVSWATRSHQILAGDRVFIAKVGEPPKGIFAEGYAVGPPYFEANPEVNGWLVPIELTRVRNPYSEPILSLSELEQISTKKNMWAPRPSGISIPVEIQDLLMSAWLKLFADQAGPLTDMREVAADKNLSITEKETLTKARIGQGKFRADLLTYWDSSCAVTGVKNTDMLRASHVKPWRSSENPERLDLYNGLLLIPNLDQAFDKYLISFDDDGRILVSPKLTEEERRRLGILDSMKLRRVDERHKKYLVHHREYFQSV